MRRGLNLTEVVVAATLVLSMIGLLTPLSIRVGRVWQSTRQYRLAINELANQMEVLVAKGKAECEAALPNLKPSETLLGSLPDATLRGVVQSDLDGTRLVLELDWDRGTQAVPLSLVGWIDTDPVASKETTAAAAQAELQSVPSLDALAQNGRTQ